MLAHKLLIGHMDKEIYFIRPVISDGDSNEDKIDSWELIPEDPMVNAKKFEISGNTNVIDDRMTYFQNTEWTIRYRSDLNNRMRIVHDTQVYEILSITAAEQTRNRFLRIASNLLDQVYFT